MCQRCSKVFKIGELLLLISLRFCIYSQTIAWYGKERSEVGMDKETRGSIQGVKGEIYQRTSVSSTGSR